jgi:hypothetical protein
MLLLLIWNECVLRVGARHNRTRRQTARCRTFVLSLTMYAKRQVIVRRVVAMSHFRLVHIEGFAYKPMDRATSRQRAARQRTVWRASLETGRQDDSATTRRFALCRVVASPTLKEYSTTVTD